MRYQTLQQAFKEIAAAHDADLKYFTGLESDLDPSNKLHYPCLVFTPPSFDMSLDTETNSNYNKWKIHLETRELMSTTSSVDEKNIALDRTREYLKDIILEFVVNYGDDKEITKNNLTETLNFHITTQPVFLPFIDISDGVTGWQVDFEITESLYNDICQLADIF
jgi:hypothetical protein